MEQEYSIKAERFHVAGVNHYLDNIFSLSSDNPLYDSSKSELVEENFTNERIYEFEFNPKKCTLIPEPDNDFDKNAIRVEADGIQIGYIKKGSTARVRKLMASDNLVSISVDIGGGKYKIVEEYEDDEKQVYEMSRGESGYWAVVEIHTKVLKERVPQESEQEVAVSKESPNSTVIRETCKLKPEQKKKNRKLWIVSLAISVAGELLSIALPSIGFGIFFALLLVLSFYGILKNR